MPGDETAIRELLDSRSAAMGAKDIEWLMSLYSDDIVYFDLVPPLRYVGSNALRERFLDWFPRWSGPIGQQLGQLDVAAGDAVAAAWMLIRAHGTMKTGANVDYWVRVSNAFRRSGNRWTITHGSIGYGSSSAWMTGRSGPCPASTCENNTAGGA
ncbi:nuclear transport factor 2 family protein [Mesorhizobium sp. M0189]|uniref:YybH family protein n=1 Tax=unclassified Mesorhizobium TaxID=325217 RepID=UPI0033375AEA